MTDLSAINLSRPYYIYPRQQNQHIDLKGQWKLGYRDKEIKETTDLNDQSWFETDLPATTLTSVREAGILPDPYKGQNSKKYDWVDEKIWYYRKSFVIDGSVKDDFIMLCFDGADYYSRIWLNGELLGSHQGMFGGPVIEIGDYLRYGQENELIIEIKAGNYGAKENWNPRDEDNDVIKPWYISRSPNHDTRDFMSMGLWRDIRIEILPEIHIDRPFLTTVKVEDGMAELELKMEVITETISLEYEVYPDGNLMFHNYEDYRIDTYFANRVKEDIKLDIEFFDKNTEEKILTKTLQPSLYQGRNWLQEKVIFENPKLWWPNGLGESNLYIVRIKLKINEQVVDQIRFDYGIRKIDVSSNAGSQIGVRWDDWQFEINGRKLFLKGINWMPADALLDLPVERYRWLLQMAKDAGIQLIRVWGGGLIENDSFYEICNELGLMVWQDFPIGNRVTPEWPQKVWQDQVLMNIFRIRNHPSLAVYCGGNEFNPYATGNTASIGIVERSVKDFDGTRFFQRTSPDKGSIHTYQDMDPTWYQYLYQDVPFIAETGIHSFPNVSSLKEVVSEEEADKPLTNIFDESFKDTHSDIYHHFAEYNPHRVPRMLSKASQIVDVSTPSLETVTEGTQLGAAEFYQIFSELTQANYPVTTGLMPWVYKRPWTVVAIQLVDGTATPVAPYYFLKRTYEPTHVMIQLPHLLWAAEEEVQVQARVLHSGDTELNDLKVAVTIYDKNFNINWQEVKSISAARGPSVNKLDMGKFTIPEDFRDSFFFMVAELRDDDCLLSRSVYWPRCLRLMEDQEYRENYRKEPAETLTFKEGPWLKPQVSRKETTLKMEVIDCVEMPDDRREIKVRIKNSGQYPAFPVKIDTGGIKNSYYADDNYFWLAPGEEKEVRIEILLREDSLSEKIEVKVSAWNSKSLQESVTI